MRVAMLFGQNRPTRPDEWHKAAAAVADVVDVVAVHALTLPAVRGLPYAGRDPERPHHYQVAVPHGGAVARRVTAGRVAGVLRHEAAECGRFDLLHGHLPGAQELLPRLARSAGLPYVLTEDDPSLFGHPTRPLPGRPARRGRARIYREAAAVLAVSDAVLLRLGELRLPGRHRLVPHPVGPELLPPVPARTRISQDPVRVAAAGRFEAYEGWEVLVHAFAAARVKDPRLRLDVVAEGSAELPADVRELIRTCGVAHFVTVRRARGRAEALHTVAHADLYLMASHVESFCVRALDALCCGTPVVGTRTGALPELVGHDGGVLVEPGDAPALGRALVEAAARLSARRPTALADRTRRRYGTAAVGARLAVVYAEASSGRGRA
ncbi:glycosyltransferase family 4 protein [Actinacidiphila glaucinigra]|uniref:glycosyltransferase family 4 protein n=1 Tax=Actinacidiphila glaucinigra TaxID=235986 RepID=UPI0036E6FE64